jgi:hypothetical protein
VDDQIGIFVTRIKKNAVYTVIKTLREDQKEKGNAMVLREEIIEIEYSPEDENGKKQTKQKKKLRLKKVCYQDEQNRILSSSPIAWKVR